MVYEQVELDAAAGGMQGDHMKKNDPRTGKCVRCGRIPSLNHGHECVNCGYLAKRWRLRKRKEGCK